MPRPKEIPAYTLHKPTGCARVRINGEDHYLGRYGTPESRAEYARVIAETFRPGAPPPPVNTPMGTYPDISVNEMLVKYLEFADGYYVKDGVPTGEAANMRDAVRPLQEFYGMIRAREFGPLALKAIRQHLLSTGNLARKVINSRIKRICRVFKWAVSEEVVPPGVYEALRTVDGLRFGRCNARESEPVRPVPEEVVQATLKFLPPQLVDAVKLQAVTGMRPANVVGIRWADIDRSGDVWMYRPPNHKNQYRERDLAVPLGPNAQVILRRYQHRPPELPIFSPQEVEQWRKEQRRRHRHRKTKIFPCELKRIERESKARSKRKRGRAPGVGYTTDSFREAINYAMKKALKAGAIIPHWHPNQLRHSRGTELRRQFGLEAAQVSLGHAKADVTEIYAERDLARAVEIARMTG